MTTSNCFLTDNHGSLAVTGAGFDTATVTAQDLDSWQTRRDARWGFSWPPVGLSRGQDTDRGGAGSTLARTPARSRCGCPRFGACFHASGRPHVRVRHHSPAGRQRPRSGAGGCDPPRCLDGDRRPGPGGRCADERRTPCRDTMGEILMRGNTAMTGFFRDPRAPPKPSPGGGAVHSPDGGCEAMVQVTCRWRVAGSVGWR